MRMVRGRECIESEWWCLAVPTAQTRSAAQTRSKSPGNELPIKIAAILGTTLVIGHTLLWRPGGTPL